MIILRPDQEAVRAEAFEHLFAGRNVLVIAPTGFGKGEVIASMLAEDASSGKTVLFLVHLEEIAVDIARRVSGRGALVSIISGDAKPNPEARVIICTFQTMAARDLKLNV